MKRKHKFIFCLVFLPIVICPMERSKGKEKLKKEPEEPQLLFVTAPLSAELKVHNRSITKNSLLLIFNNTLDCSYYEKFPQEFCQKKIRIGPTTGFIQFFYNATRELIGVEFDGKHQDVWFQNNLVDDLGETLQDNQIDQDTEQKKKSYQLRINGVEIPNGKKRLIKVPFRLFLLELYLKEQKIPVRLWNKVDSQLLLLKQLPESSAYLNQIYSLKSASYLKNLPVELVQRILRYVHSVSILRCTISSAKKRYKKAHIKDFKGRIDTIEQVKDTRGDVNLHSWCRQYCPESTTSNLIKIRRTEKTINQDITVVSDPLTTQAVKTNELKKYLPQFEKPKIKKQPRRLVLLNNRYQKIYFNGNVSLWALPCLLVARNNFTYGTYVLDNNEQIIDIDPETSCISINKTKVRGKKSFEFYNHNDGYRSVIFKNNWFCSTLINDYNPKKMNLVKPLNNCCIKVNGVEIPPGEHRTIPVPACGVFLVGAFKETEHKITQLANQLFYLNFEQSINEVKKKYRNKLWSVSESSHSYLNKLAEEITEFVERYTLFNILPSVTIQGIEREVAVKKVCKSWSDVNEKEEKEKINIFGSNQELDLLNDSSFYSTPEYEIRPKLKIICDAKLLELEELKKFFPKNPFEEKKEKERSWHDRF